MTDDKQFEEELNKWLSGVPRDVLRKFRHDVLGYVALVDGTADLLLQDLTDSDVDPQLLEMLGHIMNKAHDVRNELQLLIEYARYIQIDGADSKSAPE